MTTMPWFRLYAEMASDAKIQMLAFEDQRHYVMLLCLECNGTLDASVPSAAYRERLIAKGLGLDPSSAVEAKRRLIEGGLIGDDWHPLKWESRQFKSDHDAAERKRNQRARDALRDGHNNVTTGASDSHATDQSREDTEPDQSQTTTASRDPQQAAEFIDFKIAYPKRGGDQGWRKAVRAANARIAEGHSWTEMVAGAARYAEYVRFTGSEGTEYVKQAATFLGPDKHFLEPWTPPATKADVRLKSNLSAAEEFLRRTEPTDETV